MLGGKIHRATVTETDIDYIGSITVDQDLLDAAGILPFELVHIYDITNGARFQTYTYSGERGSGIIGLNGAAARLVHKGDKIIILNYIWIDEEVAKGHKPKIVLVDDENRFLENR
jgi:aspartate 1-decarboxylase